MATTNIKDEARRLIDEMADNSTWDDLMSKIYVRQAIESGLADSQAGRTTSVETVRAEFGLGKSKSTGRTQRLTICGPFTPMLQEIRLNMPCVLLIG
jgi:hypothetical protein